MHKNRFVFGVAIIVILAGVILAFLWLRPAAEANSELDNPQQQSNSTIRSVLFSGDSISDGWHASIKSKGFVYRVEKELAPIKSFHNHMHGYTVGQVGEKFFIPEDVDLAIIELGTNDVNKGTTLEAFEINYPTYIERVMTKSPRARLICLGVFPYSERGITFDSIIENTCEAHQGQFISISDISQSRRGVDPAGTETWAGKSTPGHPNDFGHAVIANRIFTALGR